MNMKFDVLPSTFKYAFRSLALLATLLITNVPAVAQQNPDNKIVARIGNYVVLKSEIDSHVDRLVGKMKVSDRARLVMQKAALDELVNQQLVMHYLERKQYLPNKTQLDIRLDILKEGFDSSGTTLEAHLRSKNISEQKFLEGIRWKMGWQKYLDKYMTDENVASFFRKHQPDFDGRKIEVAHILLKVPNDASEDMWRRAEEQLAEIRDEILTEKLAFAEAAAKHSQASTGKAGGGIGLIERHQPMHESFSAAAFALNKGEITTPIRSPFGVHLIQCIDIEQGKETWKSAREKVELAMKKFLFQWLANLERKQVQVEYSPATGM